VWFYKKVTNATITQAASANPIIKIDILFCLIIFFVSFILLLFEVESRTPIFNEKEYKCRRTHLYKSKSNADQRSDFFLGVFN
jgi:hypothetical protein